MRIVQLVATYSWGDAIGNEVSALHSFFKREGFESVVVAAAVAPSVIDDEVRDPGFLNQLNSSDVVILHLAIANPINGLFADLPCQKVVRYHNVTPPEFFEPYNMEMEEICRDGLRQTSYLADKCDYCIADSEWNKADLVNLGYECPIWVVPVAVPLTDYHALPEQRVLDAYQSLPGTNIVFTGRVAPNKCHHDIIRAFDLYKKEYDPNARLFLVGSYGKEDLYYQKLLAYISCLGVRDVVLTGRVSLEEIIAYYHLADAFVCMSEHEGFCVPLVEAMYFDVPVVAYDSTAVGMTLGEGGVLLQSKHPIDVATALNVVCTDKDVRECVARRQRKRMNDFAIEKTLESFLRILQDNKRITNE